jgi:hypothetical protein
MSGQAVSDIRVERVGHSRHTKSSIGKTKFAYSVEFGPEGVAIVTEPVESAVVFKLRRTLWPSAVGQSVWSAATTLMKQNLHGTAKSLGYEPKSQSPTINVQQAIEKMQPATKAHDAKGQTALPPSQKTHPGEGTPAATAAASDLDKPSKPSGRGTLQQPSHAEGSSEEKPRAVRDIFPLPQMARHTGEGPWHAFRQKLARTWKPKRPFPARGSVRVEGLIEVGGPRGEVLLDVRAYWDPKTKAWNLGYTYLAVRTVRRYRPIPPPDPR